MQSFVGVNAWEINREVVTVYNDVKIDKTMRYVEKQTKQNNRDVRKNMLIGQKYLKRKLTSGKLV